MRNLVTITNKYCVPKLLQWIKSWENSRHNLVTMANKYCMLLAMTKRTHLGPLGEICYGTSTYTLQEDPI